MTNAASKLLALFFIVLFAAGCARKSERAAPPPGNVTVSANVPPSERSRIVTMHVAITVDHFDDAVAKLRASVDQAGGYVSDLQAGGTIGEQTASIELRVPANRAQAVRGELGALGEVTSANEKVEDVEQRADLDARILSAKTQEKRLLEIMAQRSGTISDLVETEKELARVRENVERLEAEQRSLVSKVDLATIHVALTTRAVPAWQTPAASLADAAATGLHGAKMLAVYGTMAFLTVAPTLVPLTLVIVVAYVVMRRRRVASLAG